MDPRFLDHFQNPRNVGELQAPQGAAQIENPVCGDRLQVTLCLEGERVSALKYRVQGCSGSIAAASAMSVLVKGLLLAEASLLDREAIEERLGGLPPLKRHGADLAAAALREAIMKARRRDAGA